MDLKKKDVEVWTELYRLGWSQIAGICERDDRHSVSLKHSSIS